MKIKHGCDVCRKIKHGVSAYKARVVCRTCYRKLKLVELFERVLGV